LTFYQALGFDISSKYSGKASVQCFIGVSNLNAHMWPNWRILIGL